MRRYVGGILGGGESFLGGRSDWQAQQRARLLESIKRLNLPDGIVAAIAAVPRERFVPRTLLDRAYDDVALPIGDGQSISQPSLVAAMLAEMRVMPRDRVLEVGTGSGYQAALLSKLAANVVTVERFASLAKRARSVFEELGISNVAIRSAGDQLGWPDGAPYDSIIVAAAAPRVPASLVGQLRAGGRMVIPVGSRQDQKLNVVTRTGIGFEVMESLTVRFVPLVSPDAFPD